jgi:hypothetical protein
VLRPWCYFSLWPSGSKLVGMDIPDPNKATEIAHAYLKQLRQQTGPTREIQKPEVLAWNELEQRLQLESPPDRPKKVKQVLPRGTPTIKKLSKQEQSIWKRTISELLG